MGAITGARSWCKFGAEHFPLIDRCFAKFGVHVTHRDGWSHACVEGKLKVVEPFTANTLQKVEAAPWPYLPVDRLPSFVALGVQAQGSAMFWNKVYDGAMGWTSELSKSEPASWPIRTVVTLVANPSLDEVESTTSSRGDAC